MKTKTVAVVLSGCGVFDGAEINEVVLSLLSLEENGIQYECFAPDIEQHHVINHLNGEATTETRNVLQESARIVRGHCKPLTELKSMNYDGLLVPGGFGVAKNLSNLALEGAEFAIYDPFLTVCRAFKSQHKPAAYLCIAPALLGKIYDDVKVQCTIGHDPHFTDIIQTTGGEHVNTAVNEIVIDVENKVLSTSCYMLAENICQARSGITKLVSALNEMML